MANSYGIPAYIEAEIRKRNKRCVYCHKPMIYPWLSSNRKDSATIDHLDHKPPFRYRPGQTKEDFAICCGSCNSSRGKKKLSVWLDEEFNKKDGKIRAKTIAPVIKKYLDKQGSTLF